MKRLIGHALLVVVMAGAAACGKDEPRNADTATIGSSAGTMETMKVTDVSVGRSIGADDRISDATDTFRPTDDIYAVVETEGGATGQALVARWMFEDGQLVNEQTQTVATSGGKAYTQFRLTKASAWPVGKYTLHVMRGDAEVATKTFEVKQ